ncbi:hypothetical protein [Achromobacter mucicolens]|uniref:hypothetical protein n=1 Tax=Achromobacter mucicolens TaxID=1389922 RepID=UPI0022F3B775|nr:hypothetical protein [Achromobacter mucicolens]WBX87729.1 hypothetical protein PE062_20200 [Achromobacter mucicolens]
MHYNLRESGQVGAELHEALQAFSEQNQSRLLNDERRSATIETLYTRYDTGIFKRSRNPNLKTIRELLLSECDNYAHEVYGDQIRQAQRHHTMWFVVQRFCKNDERLDSGCRRRCFERWNESKTSRLDLGACFEFGCFWPKGNYAACST